MTAYLPTSPPSPPSSPNTTTWISAPTRKHTTPWWRLAWMPLWLNVCASPTMYLFRFSSSLSFAVLLISLLLYHASLLLYLLLFSLSNISIDFAHLFIRDPLVIYSDRISIDDQKYSDHFENIQSTNWQTVRFKPPPPGSPIGWRVEFRPMEVQFTDFENAAFVSFAALLTRVVSILYLSLSFSLPSRAPYSHLRTSFPYPDISFPPSPSSSPPSPSFFYPPSPPSHPLTLSCPFIYYLFMFFGDSFRYHHLS